MERVNDETWPTAIVTGSTKGIGKATAELLTKRGRMLSSVQEIKTTMIKPMGKLNQQ